MLIHAESDDADWSIELRSKGIVSFLFIPADFASLAVVTAVFPALDAVIGPLRTVSVNELPLNPSSNKYRVLSSKGNWNGKETVLQAFDVREVEKLLDPAVDSANPLKVDSAEQELAEVDFVTPPVVARQVALPDGQQTLIVTPHSGGMIGAGFWAAPAMDGITINNKSSSTAGAALADDAPTSQTIMNMRAERLKPWELIFLKWSI